MAVQQRAYYIETSSMVEIQQMIQTFKNKGVVIMRATNDTLAGVKSESVKLIGAKTTLKAATIRERFQVIKMQINSLAAEVACAGEPTPLIEFGARQVNKGVSVNILKGNRRSIIKHAFIAEMKSGHRGVFWREKNIRGTRWKVGTRMTLPSIINKHSASGSLVQFRLKIRELYGPPVPEFWDDPDIMDAVLQNASIRLQDRLEHHTNRLIEAARAA